MDSSKQPDFLARGCRKAPSSFQRENDVFSHSCAKMDTYDWMKDIPLPSGQAVFDCVEVRFKNNRKDFFRLPGDVQVFEGDIVAVEGNPGHDIGIVSMTGEMVKLQMKKRKINFAKDEIKKLYRKARPADIEKWVSAIELEMPTMFKTRKIAEELKLNMKINDVEYQGDRTKAIFYYTADDRVDFRELIKILAEKFQIRVEMKQIGARQEAARLGGIGSCGRELCCASWLNQFHSVSTGAARIQQLSLNPQKLAGQCGKLKCCINYEYDHYVDALKNFPSRDIQLKTKKGNAVHQKTDIFKNVMWYAYTHDPNNLLAIPVEMVKRIIQDNAAGKLPEQLEDFAQKSEKKVEVDTPAGLDELRKIEK